MKKQQSVFKDGFQLGVVKHPQPFGEFLYEVEAPDGFAWDGEVWSIHGDSVEDLQQRADSMMMIPTEETDL